jgi:hypothetical protein
MLVSYSNTRSNTTPDARVLIGSALTGEAVLAAVDAHAARLGLSRADYIRRRLASDAATSRTRDSGEDLRKFGGSFADLADEAVMDAAWR